MKYTIFIIANFLSSNPWLAKKIVANWPEHNYTKPLQKVDRNDEQSLQ